MVNSTSRSGPRVSSILIGLSIASLVSACATEEYTRPIQFTPHGHAVRANMAAQIINPLPPSKPLDSYDAQRPTLAVTAYRTDAVKEPVKATNKSASGDVAAE